MIMRSFLLALLVGSASAFAPLSSVGRTATVRYVAIDTSEIKNGMTIELDKEPYKVLNFSVMKQARGAAKMTIRFKNLMRGNTIENTYRSGEKFETAMIEKKKSQYTYSDENGNLFFMDSETFEEVVVDSKVVDDKEKWIDEGMELSLVYFNDEVIEVNLPSNYVYKIIETTQAKKGTTKPATLSCGAVINVPGYLEEGEMIKVDTDKAEFLERTK
eukprot:CAMPEP_0194176518 /NCGR_PEP_ID=MMETSP0154-20130528/10424_1 /TAXON_ID=1049557 /ORGANISM="Thalassiothrix antarctica, Strain L6-D1" /LENGTH=215 /DNA_ID=CAMNT_0038890735 /DNA_START=73 /DNA_END=720 /DNA_ORIENTATION=-